MTNPEFFFSLRDDVKNNKEFLPTRAHQDDTGWDVRFCPKDHKAISIRPFEYVKLPIGIRAMSPNGFWLSMKPRSSSFIKKQLHFLYGTIDSSFEGELQICCQMIPTNSFKNTDNLTIEFGEAIGQLIPVKLQEMIIKDISNEELDSLYKARGGKRGEGGFGSTGG